jgi:hypothetical protein
MKGKKIHVITMMIGLLLAVAVICSHIFQTVSTKISSKAKSEQKTSQTEDDFYYAAGPTITPPASAHVHTNLVAHCLFEIIRPEGEKESFSSDSGIHPQKFLITLFRVIISPNAP